MNDYPVGKAVLGDPCNYREFSAVGRVEDGRKWSFTNVYPKHELDMESLADFQRMLTLWLREFDIKKISALTGPVIECVEIEVEV